VRHAIGKRPDFIPARIVPIMAVITNKKDDETLVERRK
jgi:hypothetical protein